MLAVATVTTACRESHPWHYDPPPPFQHSFPPSDVQPPDASRPPLQEVCANGVDDNGDGQTDEHCDCVLGSTQTCFVGATAMAGVGACAFGSQRCVGDGGETHWTACEGSGQPTLEICDGFDNNCDGTIDETCPCDQHAIPTCYRGPPATLGVGLCHAGQLTCSTGQGDVPDPIRCDGDVVPAIEICDGLDNDCNGAVDDIPERCDAVDNNCNGVVDEGCPTLGSIALRRYMGHSGSGIVPLDHSSLYVMEPSTIRCPPGELPVEVAYGEFVCAPPPPQCPAGQAPSTRRHGTAFPVR